VFMDLVSGYLVFEEVAEERSYDTWHTLVKARLETLGVRVFYLVSDRAKALIKLAETGLECLSIPDLFHLLHDLVKPTFKGVWSTVVNFALWPPPDTKPGQYPQHHKRSDDSLGRHALGGWAYCPQRSVRVSLA
jgi:hypothetical protein